MSLINYETKCTSNEVLVIYSNSQAVGVTHIKILKRAESEIHTDRLQRFLWKPEADPEFPRRDRQPQRGANQLFGHCPSPQKMYENLVWYPHPCNPTTPVKNQKLIWVQFYHQVSAKFSKSLPTTYEVQGNIMLSEVSVHLSTGGRVYPVLVLPRWMPCSGRVTWRGGTLTRWPYPLSTPPWTRRSRGGEGGALSKWPYTPRLGLV